MALRRDSLCPQALRTAEFSHRRHAGFPTVIAKTRAGSVMVHVTTTLRLAPTHSFLESSPTKVSQPVQSENSSQRRPRRKCPEGAISEGRDGKFLMPNSENPHEFSWKTSHFRTPIAVQPAIFRNRASDAWRSERYLRQY